MNVRLLLRFEGLGVFVAALAVYWALGGPLWLLLVLALAPDLAMVGYAAGPRVGAFVYDAFHVYPLPLAVAGAGLWFGVEYLALAGVVWVGHVGADRAAGYGLKYETGFSDTHLDRA
ncbi:MAG: DUF4260 domain-containing protein [Halobacteriaceae archaeon]